MPRLTPTGENVYNGPDKKAINNLKWINSLGNHDVLGAGGKRGLSFTPRLGCMLPVVGEVVASARSHPQLLLAFKIERRAEVRRGGTDCVPAEEPQLDPARVSLCYVCASLQALRGKQSTCFPNCDTANFNILPSAGAGSTQVCCFS